MFFAPSSRRENGPGSITSISVAPNNHRNPALSHMIRTYPNTQKASWKYILTPCVLFIKLTYIVIFSKSKMLVDFIHPHIQHHHSCHTVPPIFQLYDTKPIDLLRRSLRPSLRAEKRSNDGDTGFQRLSIASKPSPQIPQTSDLTLFTDPILPTITLTPCEPPTVKSRTKMDKRFLRPPDRTKACNRSLRCKCEICSRRKTARLAELKARRKKIFCNRGYDEGEQSEIS